MLFVDTSAWYAAWVSTEPQHQEVRAILADRAGDLVTTDYIVDELLTLLQARGLHRTALLAGAELWRESTAELCWLTATDVEAGWLVFQRSSDKRWSFTDCTSYAVMQRLGITEALSLDDHFRQFGFAAVLP